ncbi:MAG: YifB family Mg chelatase-like AAA ATPase [Tidjanibacter sp.]|nr:YifB family Mg chelatase-like AAA ATPase [Tidjanibacter sp.]
MAFTRVYSSTLVGINALKVEVEVNVTPGLGMFLVGLPDSAVKESQERVRSAFENSGLRMVGKKVVVNLAPADLKKEGSALDLPIAIAILAATEQVENEGLERWIIAGELSLDGSVKPIRGALPMAIEAAQSGFRGVILPRENAEEAAVVESLEVIGVGNLREAVDFLSGTRPIAPTKVEVQALFEERANRYAEDFADVKGQEYVKRALEVAAAGGHNIVMIGAPGSGKTMLARRMPTIMPPLSLEEALETTKIHSVAGKLGSEKGLLSRRPFRSPHHLASAVAMVGGGSNPQPGEISLAHNGILFLDELPEFGRSILEVMRQPLEDKVVTVARAKYSVAYPANFMLVASMNPCPCGYYNHPTKECNCSRHAVERYINKISGPLMDRIDIQIEVTPVEYAQMNESAPAEPSSTIRERVIAAREIQRQRFEGIEGVFTNAMMNSSMLAEFCPLDEGCRTLLGRAMERLSLSARAYNRIVKVARTIADLDQSEHITSAHIAEAIGYRNLDRENWGNRES